MGGTDVGLVDATAPPASAARRIAFTVCTVIFGLAAAGALGFGLVIGWFDNEDGGIHRVHLLGFGILFGVLVAAPLLAMARRPERRPSAFLQVAVAALAGLAATALAAGSGYLAFAVAEVAIVGVLLALHPDRRGVLHPVARPSVPMGVVALAGSVPLVAVGLTYARLQRIGPPSDPHVSQDHWVNMAAMVFAIALVALFASARVRGWLLSAWCAGIALALYGIASVVFARFPGSDVPYPGSVGTGWGIAAVVGGLGFIALAEWEARRSRRA
ncbi:MAG TPA: hypothetical protein VID47_09365 [Actinomycetota bacterium]|jgi:hypothetical protein